MQSQANNNEGLIHFLFPQGADLTISSTTLRLDIVDTIRETSEIIHYEISINLISL